jgi:zona occludens toxin
VINLLIGAPGGGKSYEAVVFHILTAVLGGRKVVTNLPLLLPAFDAIQPGLSGLIELREKTLAVRPSVADGNEGTGVLALVKQARASRFLDRPFAHPEDYADPWRKADGTGVLYVIDECHFALPMREASRAVLEWFSMHRHFNVDVLLITQSVGKLHADIKDLVQVVYKVRKATAFGRSDRYIRKVLDGIRGSEIAVSERTYEKRYFSLYRSHTRGMAVDEATPDDVSPFIIKFRRFTWVVFGVLAVAVLAVGLYLSSHSFVKGAGSAAQLHAPGAVPGQVRNMGQAWAAAKPVEPGSAAVATVVAVKAVKAVVAGPDAWPDPFQGKGVHLVGKINGVRKDGFVLAEYVLAISENASFQTSMSVSQLTAAGFVYHALTDCVGMLEWHGHVRAVTCDAPQISPSVGAAGNSATQPNADMPLPGTGNVTPSHGAPAGGASAAADAAPASHPHVPVPHV